MADNIHATLILLDDAGILVTGPSGAGKSSLALDLLTHARGFAALVSDDRVIVDDLSNGRLIGHAPASIQGRIEVHGLGIVPYAFEASATIDLIVELVDPGAIERMPQPQTRDAVRVIQVPWRSGAIGRQLVTAALRQLNSGL